MVRLVKVLTIGIALLVLGSPELQASQFLDVPQGIWYEGAVSNLEKLGLVEGYSGNGGRYFRPAQLVTRAEFLRLCLRALVKGGLRDFLSYPPDGPPFPDVPVAAWFAPDVAFAKEWGVVDHGLASFEPNRAITRAEAVEMISRTMEPVPVRGYQGFSDVSAGNYHIRRVYEAGIIDGYRDGTFRPSQALNRAEAAVLVEKAYFLSIVPPVIGLRVSVFSPQAPHLPEVEVAPALGISGIRLNNPDSAENLVHVEISGKPSAFNTGVRYYLRRSHSFIRVWRELERTSAPLLGPADEQEIAEEELRRGMELWVENTDLGEADLVLEARRTSDGGVIESERTTFRTFRSLIIVLGGETQDPANYDPNDPTRCTSGICGVFDIGHSLRGRGYDALIFDEDDVKLFGDGPTLEVVREAVQNREITSIAILGYSHGGGSVLDLSWALKDQRAEIGSFTLSFTAYIDAIASLTPHPEIYRPYESAFHLNIYQTNDFPLHGQEISSAAELPTENMCVTDTDWGSTLGHSTIDDDEHVASEVIRWLSQRIDR
jgi:hypothetical protein